MEKKRRGGCGWMDGGGGGWVSTIVDREGVLVG